jgi:hypothetical protein
VQWAFVAILLLVFSGRQEQLANVLLGLAHELAEHLGAVDDGEALGLQGLRQLPGNEGLPRAGRAVEQDALDVLDAELLDDGVRQTARGEGAAEETGQLVVQPADAQGVHREVGRKDVLLLQLGRPQTHLLLPTREGLNRSLLSQEGQPVVGSQHAVDRQDQRHLGETDHEDLVHA